MCACARIFACLRCMVAHVRDSVCVLYILEFDGKHAHKRTSMRLTFWKDRKREVEKKDCERKIVKDRL